MQNEGGSLRGTHVKVPSIFSLPSFLLLAKYTASGLC